MFPLPFWKQGAALIPLAPLVRPRPAVRYWYGAAAGALYGIFLASDVDKVLLGDTIVNQEERSPGDGRHGPSGT